MSYTNRSDRKRPGNTYGRQQNNGGGNSRRRTGQYINPALFVRQAKPVQLDDYVPKHAFMDFNINVLLKNNLKNKGFELPTPIQDQTIALALEGKDIIGMANTGTGKTAAFAVPVLHQLMDRQNSRAIIIAPTRELAQQIEDDCRWIAKGSGIRGALLIGGTAMGPQLRDLRANPRIVIGTPGRIKDHVEQGTLDLSMYNLVVLDEVDRMLDMGFINDVRHIVSRVANKKQSFFFSATMDSRISGIIQDFAVDPTTISVKTNEGSENVNQDIVSYNTTHDKLDKLHNILIKENVAKVIVFDETKYSVERLSKELIARGFKADAIHGGKSQSQRQRSLDRFKKDVVNILVATDVAARGIDVSNITHVINYSTPQSYSDYIHRIGRTGRAGQIGNALTFVNG